MIKQVWILVVHFLIKLPIASSLGCLLYTTLIDAISFEQSFLTCQSIIFTDCTIYDISFLSSIG